METDKIACARGHEGGVGTMSSAQAEFDQQFTRSDQNRPRSLGRNGCLEVEKINQAGFDELCLGKRRDNLEDRLVWEKHSPLGHGVDVASEAHALEPLKEVGTKVLGVSRPRDVLCRKGEFFEKCEHRLKTRGDKKIALRRQLADEKLEHGRPVHLMLPIGLQHGQLIPVGQQRPVVAGHALVHGGLVCRPWCMWA